MPKEWVTHGAWVGTRLPRKLRAEGERIAAAQRITLSELMRVALQREVQRHDRGLRVRAGEPRPDPRRERQPVW